MRIVRQEIRRAEIEGVPWQRVIDAVRPSIARVWESWSSSERRRFLRHLRPWWDVFRHRMPPRIAERIHVLIQSGDLEVRACRIRTFGRAGAELELAITQTTRVDQVLRPKHVINCTGPRTDFDFLSSPIVLDARRRRLIRADPLDLGIETDACAVLDKNGKASDWLYAVGPLTRPAWWEITAAPEINAQILELARSFTAADTARASFAEVFQDLGAGI
jgi:uncharacterized NAD(P)/FAD-binding protein YdhS